MMNNQANSAGSASGWSRPPPPPRPPGPAQSYGMAQPQQQQQQPQVQMLMDEVRQLQQKVREMSQGKNGSSAGTGASNAGFDQYQQEPQRILFGVVERIKILHNKRSAALVQMQTQEMAEHAVNEQHVLNRIGAEIYVNFSNKVSEIRMPAEKGLPDDGFSKDFTLAFGGPPGGPFFGQGPFSGQGPPGPKAMMNYNMMNPVGESCGICILVSCLPPDMANPDAISNLFGHYGDVHKVKVLHNKPDCALVQMAKPHHAALCRQFLDQVKIENNTLCVSYSRIQGIKMPTEIEPEQEKIVKDFSNTKGVHRFRNPIIAAKLSKNLSPPSQMLHVANLPEDFSTEELKNYLLEQGYTVSDIEDCSKEGGGKMALVQMGTTEEAIRALAKLHNVTPEGYTTRNNSGLCFSFSGRKTKAQFAAILEAKKAAAAAVAEPFANE